jgi:diguanylate cyclase (GGDEF)-like protein
MWLAGIAAGVCLLTIIAGVVLIGRVMSASVDRLVDGAIRFSEGDRIHRIDVRVPPELRRVANEFNRMISRIHAYEDVLADRALTDALTGLPNRRAFDEAIGRNWDRARQFGEPFAMLQIDVDHFKHVNDSYGHAAGDDVLRRVADALSRQLRAAHPVFRTGGEEFIVLVPGARIPDAAVIAERLRTEVAVVASPFAGNEISVTISVGVTDSMGCANPDAMIRAADAALYDAKTQGRNRVVASGAGNRSNEDAA